ncbi:MAG: rhodanese-like domain-containing protein [Proteobacteria bacterium]|nr:rhodanese-like domain-containing protein [Pseudomonadota bacterium]MBU1708742.1 rhodanese-like domain-containing protein [Pseudomonadota bacterium]
MRWLQFFTPVQSIDSLEAKALLADHADEYFLLDVRQPREYEKSHIPGAKLIPLPDLPGRMAELDKNKNIIVY